MGHSHLGAIVRPVELDLAGLDHRPHNPLGGVEGRCHRAGAAKRPAVELNASRCLGGAERDQVERLLAKSGVVVVGQDFKAVVDGPDGSDHIVTQAASTTARQV